MVSFPGLFNHLGEKSEKQLRWVDKDKSWTQWMLQCFDEYMDANHRAEGISNYMGIDRVWRYPIVGYMILALEHENNFDRQDFLGQEIQHLVDVMKALRFAR